MRKRSQEYLTVSGNRVALLFRYIDPDNFLGVELRDNGTVNLIQMLDGRQTTVASGSYSGSAPYTTYVRCSGASYVVRVEGSQVISATDSDIGHGTIGLWDELVTKFLPLAHESQVLKPLAT